MYVPKTVRLDEGRKEVGICSVYLRSSQELVWSEKILRNKTEDDKEGEPKVEMR